MIGRTRGQTFAHNLFETDRRPMRASLRSLQRVVFQPAVYRGMQRGIRQLADAIRPTLGAQPRLVAVSSIVPAKAPELLDDGALIARRIIELSEPDQNVGAMYLRGVLTRLGETVGDGTATAAVLFQSVYDQGVRYIVSGGDPIALRRYLEVGMQRVLEQLEKLSRPLVGRRQLNQMAQSLCPEPELATLLAEIFDIIGEYGPLDIQGGQRREADREYVEGMYWERGAVARAMLVEAAQTKTELQNAAILISDVDVQDVRQVVPLLVQVRQANLPGLLIVAGSYSDTVIGFLLANCKPGQFQVVAVHTPGRGAHETMAVVEDLAILTGGQPVLKAAGATLEQVTLGHLGRARRVWVDRSYFGIAGGKGDPRQLRSHIASLRAAYAHTDDASQRRQLRERIGKLLGGSATLWVGGLTSAEVERRKALAERCAEALRGALRAGVVPGGGAALLACRPVLRAELNGNLPPDGRAAYRLLLRALEAPARTIIANAGYDASEVMAEINLAGTGYGFDVRSGQVVDMLTAGILDATSVQQAAFRAAVSAAAQALTLDVVVLKPPEEAKSRRGRR